MIRLVTQQTMSLDQAEDDAHPIWSITLKNSDISPFVLLVTGAATGALLAAIVFPETIPLPDGWGDVAGSALGVIGAFYVARYTYRLEQRTKDQEANKPISSQIEIVRKSMEELISGLEQNVTPMKNLGETIKAELTPNVVKEYNRSIRSRLHGLFSEESSKTSRYSFSFKVRNIASRATTGVNYTELYNTGLLAPRMLKACEVIYQDYQGRLEADEIIWLPIFMDCLGEVINFQNEATEIIATFNTLSKDQELPIHRHTGIKIALAPTNLLRELKAHQKPLNSLSERLGKHGVF